MPGRGEIGPYHNGVAEDVKTVIGERVSFYTPLEANWHKVRDGSEVEFELVPVDRLRPEPAKRMRRKDGQGRRVCVFPLFTVSNSRLTMFWVSWHETWLKENPTKYVLLNAGWTLFEGLAGTQDKTQVLRADWDQLEHRGSKRAGQPHWHFDHELFIRAEPDKVEVAPGLVEVSTEDAFAMAGRASVGYVHLAMGAWNKDLDHPECWQRTYEDDCQQLRDWCVKTLRYVKEQVTGQ